MWKGGAGVAAVAACLALELVAWCGRWGGASLALGSVVATSDDVPSAELIIDVRTRTSYVRSKDVLHTY